MEEESSKAPSHNNLKEAANYVRSVNSLLKSFDESIRGFDHYKCLDFSTHVIPASLQIGQRILHDDEH